MNLKQKIVFEVTKNERVYQFVTEVNSPLGESYDACFAVLEKIVELSKTAASKAERVSEKSNAGQE